LIALEIQPKIGSTAVVTRSGIQVSVAGALVLLIAVAASSQTATGHGDPVAPLVLSLAALLITAKIGAEVATRLGQPAVLGELAGGMLLGSAGALGLETFEPLKTDPTVALLAGLGVLLLLFSVGLESTVAQMLRVASSALFVAVLGVVAPFVLGWMVGMWLLPDAGTYAHAFLGATLCATSIGITARVLQDLGWSRSSEARIILGAAVIDDVLGLIILAVVTGAIAAASEGAALSIGAVAWVAAKATVFLVGALWLGVSLAPRAFALAATLRTGGVLLTIGLSFCFLLAWLADEIDLAPIVGAFAAGLILENVHYQDFVNRGERPLEDLVHPLTDFLAPIFFVLMGLRTDLAALVQPNATGLAAALIVAAIIGKQFCSLGVWTPGINRLAIGIGMIPRGEVGLIFANVGAGLTLNGEPVVDARTFSALVLMVIVTTLITPPAFKWSVRRGQASGLTRPAA
jgi:Kef-type K+ transport system membrane component KefB